MERQNMDLKKFGLIFGMICSLILSATMMFPLQAVGTTTSDNGAMYGTLTGIVTDADTDNPIPNTVMTLKYHDMIRIDRTDADGWYEFDNVPICFCLKNISAFKEGYEPEYQLVGVSELTYANFTLNSINNTTPDPEDPEDPEDPGDPNEPEEPPEDEEPEDTSPPDDNDGMYGTITGVITDGATNEPVSGATVKLEYHDEMRTQYTDKNGEYTFTQIPICFCLKNLSVQKEGYLSQFKLVAVHELTYVNFTMELINGGSEKENDDSSSGSSAENVAGRNEVENEDDQELNNFYIILFFIGILAGLIIFSLIYYTIGKEVKTRKFD